MNDEISTSTDPSLSFVTGPIGVVGVYGVGPAVRQNGVLAAERVGDEEKRVWMLGNTLRHRGESEIAGIANHSGTETQR